MRGILSEFCYNGDNIPIVGGSALCALEDKNPALGTDAVTKLL